MECGESMDIIRYNAKYLVKINGTLFVTITIDTTTMAQYHSVVIDLIIMVL